MQPLSIMIKPVSGACNMRCKYCFYTDVMSHRETKIFPKMSLETLEMVVRRAFRYAKGPVSFAFQGGEPTLIGLEFFEALVRMQREYNTQRLPVHNAVQSNGYALSDEMIAFFAREKFLLGISLDGIGETHDRMRIDQDGQPTYRRILENTRRLQQAGVEFNILCVVNEYVAQRPEEVFRELAPYGYLQFIACLDGFGGEKTAFSLTEESYCAFLKKTFDLYYDAYMSGKPVSVRSFDNYVGILLGIPPENCAMGGHCSPYFLIESDGSVYPCDFYVLDEWKLGNIKDTPFNRLAKAETALKFREDSLAVPEKCRSCKWNYLCRNGCKRERCGEEGLFRWCSCMGEFFDYSFPRMRKIAEKIAQTERR